MPGMMKLIAVPVLVVLFLKLQGIYALPCPASGPGVNLKCGFNPRFMSTDIKPTVDTSSSSSDVEKGEI